MFLTTKPSNETIDLTVLMALGASFKPVGKKELIFEEGSQCRYYYQLVSGSIRWVNVDDAGREYVQTFVEPGECFGELPLFDDGPYVSSAIAEKDSVIVRLKRESFLQLMTENNTLLMKMSRLMAKRLRYKFFILKTIANPSPEVRIQQLLVYLKQEGRHICPDTHLLSLTRQQIADLSGLRVETVIRAINRMQVTGALQQVKRRILVE